MTATNIGIKLSVSGDAQVKGALSGVERSMGTVGTAAKSASTALAGLASGFATFQSVGAFVRAADAVTNLNNQLKLATGSVQAAGQAYTALFDIAQSSRVSFTELGGTFAAISRAGQELGISQTRLLSVTEAIGNAMTVSGGSAAGMQAALTQLGQGLASGTLRGEELNSVMEQTPRLAKALADGLGIPIGKLREMGAAGEITAQQVIKALESQAAVLRGEVQDAVLTVAQAFTQLQNASIKAVGEFDKVTGASGAMAKEVSAMAKALQAASDAMAVAGQSGAGGFMSAMAGVGNVIGRLGFDTLSGTFNTFNGVLNAATLGTLGLKTNLDLLPDAFRTNAQQVVLMGEKIKQAEAEYAVLSERLKQAPDNIYIKSELHGLAKYIAALERARNARDSFENNQARTGTGLSESRYSAVADEAALKAAQANGQAYAKLMGELAGPQQKLTAAIFAQKAALGSLYTPEIEAALRSHYIKPTTEATKAATEAKKAAEAELEWRRKTTLDLIKLWDDQADAAQKAYDTARAGALKLADATEAAQAATTAGLVDRLAAMRDEIDTIGLTGQALTELNAIKAEQVIADKEVELIMLRNADASEVQIQLLEQEINLRKQLVVAMRTKAGKEASFDAGKEADKAAKEAADAWQKASEQIEKDITDALMRGFESGKGFAEVLRDTVVNMFKTMVLRPVIQATVQGGLNAIGLGGPGGAGGILGTASNLSSLYNAGSAAYNWLGLGASAGTGLAASTGTGLGLSAGASGIGLTGTAASGVSLGSGLAAGSGAAASGGMASIAAAAPWALAGLAVLSLIKSLDDSGTYHTGGLGSYSGAGGAAVGDAVKGQGLGFDLASRDYTASGQQAAVAMAQAVVGLLDSTAQTFGKQAGAFVATAFADDVSKDNSWAGLLIKDALGNTVIDWGNGADKWPGREFSNGEAGAKEYAAAVALDVRNLLIQQTPAWADTMLRALGDAPSIEQLAATVGQINMVQAALVGMGKASQAFANLGEAATGQLIKALGGGEAAAAGLSSYYSDFYTEAERAAIATQTLTGQFGELGIKLPDSRQALRDMIDAALKAGNPTLASNLIKLSPAFAALVPASADAASAVDTIATEMASAAKRIAQERAGLERQLLQVTGNTAGLRALDLAALDESNRGLQEQIWAYEDQAAASAAAAEAAQQAASAYAEAQSQYMQSLEEARDFIQGIAGNIRQYLDGLNAQAPGAAGYNSAAAAFSSQLTLARGGDRDALSGITGYAGTLMDAIQRESSTAAEAAVRAGRVRGQLAALPGQISAEQLIVNAVAASAFSIGGSVSAASNTQVAAIGALGAGYVAALQPVITALGTGFTTLDTNLSGALDIGEFAAALQGKATDAAINNLFNLIDTDNDKLISAAEATTAAARTFGQQVQAGLAGDFAALDTSLNNAISFDEFAAGFAGLASEDTLRATFAAIDTNGDGTISRLEAIAANTAKAATWAEAGATNPYLADKPLTAVWAADDPMRSVFQAIREGTGWLVHIHGYLGHIHNLQYQQLDAENQLHHMRNYIGGIAEGYYAVRTTSVNQGGGNLVAFAQGGAFTNSIVNRPTQFSMGLMGEAGPEAIMPLSRTANGDLGVQVQMPNWANYGRGDNNAALVAEIRAMREDNQAQARALVQLQQRLVKLNERWDANGLPETRIEA